VTAGTGSWQVTADALLIDLDGTLVDSHASIVAAWSNWAERYAVDLGAVLAIMPGRPATAVMREVRPDLAESVLVTEQATLAATEVADADRVTAMPGAAELLDALAPDQWAIVTACTRELAIARLRAAGLPIPAVLIGIDTVAVGKPDPAGYLTAANQLGTAAERSLVIEDAPAGVAAGLAAGMRVVALPPAATGPSGVHCLTAPSLRNVRISRSGSALKLSYPADSYSTYGEA
jgi:mannitol-1-/sugar-/sorbitol-6-phosphatase